MTRDTVWFFWRLTRPLSRLIFPVPVPAGAGAAAGGAAGAAGAAGLGPQAGGAAGAGTVTGGLTGGAAGAGASSTETPKSVAMPASPLAYPWPTARTFHTPPRW